MSEQSSEREGEAEEAGPLSVSDDELPEDLRPGEDNPLAEPAGDDVPDDVLTEGSGTDRSDGDSGGASEGEGDASSDAPSDEASSGAESNEPEAADED